MRTSVQPDSAAVPDVSAEFLRRATVIVIAPHPDDESLATGGLIQTAIAAGAAVRVLMLTDGDRNPWPQRLAEGRWRVGQQDRARWGALRRAEALRAMAHLGVGERMVRFLGWPDMGITHRLMCDTAPAVASVREYVADSERHARDHTVVVFPSLEDRHPDHSAAHVLARLALHGAGATASGMCYTVHGQSGATAATMPLSDAARAAKMRAVLEHRSQLVLSRGRMLRYARREESFTAPPPVRSREGPRYLLPCFGGRRPSGPVELLVVAGVKTWRIRPRTEGGSDGDLPASDPVAMVGPGGLTLTLPAFFHAPCALYVKPVSLIPSPWIYDHWGWTRLG